MSFSVPTRSTLSSALAFGADITSETIANKTGSRRVKNGAAGMAILSANTTSSDLARRRTLYRKPFTEGTIDCVRGNAADEETVAVTLPVKSTGIGGFFPYIAGMGGNWLWEALMVLNRVCFVALGVMVVAWSGLSAAQQYRPNEFLNLDLSRAVLSPKPLGPAASFAPGPLDVTVDRGNNAAQASAELVVDPKPVATATVHAQNDSTSNNSTSNNLTSKTALR